MANPYEISHTNSPYTTLAVSGARRRKITTGIKDGSGCSMIPTLFFSLVCRRQAEYLL